LSKLQAISFVTSLLYNFIFYQNASVTLLRNEIVCKRNITKE